MGRKARSDPNGTPTSAPRALAVPETTMDRKMIR
jgi:hypothetical protein